VRLVLIGLAAGFFSALFGVGGGVVIVPLLLIACGWEMRSATATSLAAIDRLRASGSESTRSTPSKISLRTPSHACDQKCSPTDAGSAGPLRRPALSPGISPGVSPAPSLNAAETPATSKDADKAAPATNLNMSTPKGSALRTTRHGTTSRPKVYCAS